MKTKVNGGTGGIAGGKAKERGAGGKGSTSSLLVAPAGTSPADPKKSGTVGMETNLRALQRVDARVVEVVAVASHVALYSMGRTGNWERLDVEGSLFIVRRNTSPMHKIVVLNRMSLENYMQPIDTGLFAEYSEPYLILMNAAKDVVAFWFYQLDELNRVASILEKLSGNPLATRDDDSSAASSRPVSPAPRVLSPVPTRSTPHQALPQPAVARKPVQQSASHLLRPRHVLSPQPSGLANKVPLNSSSNVLTPLSKEGFRRHLLELLDDPEFLASTYSNYLQEYNHHA